MYPRNAASPEQIAIGPVIQISDGVVQTSGCTVRIFPFGGAEGNGVGTTAYSTDGVVLYTPTQAETNYTSFVLIAKKVGCIPTSQTVVTTASSTAGKVDLDTVLGTTMTETNPGDVAKSLSFFFDVNPTTLNTVDDVGVAGSCSGSGARTVTVTVDDGVNPLENAFVRYTEGLNTFYALTDVAGQVVLNIDDATYVVAISKNGYSFAGATHVVTGDDTATYSMSALSIPAAPAPDTTSGFIVVRGLDLLPLAGVVIKYRMTVVPVGDLGSSFDRNFGTATSAAGTGLATMTLLKGAVYEFYVDNHRGLELLIPLAAGATYEVASFVVDQ